MPNKSYNFKQVNIHAQEIGENFTIFVYESEEIISKNILSHGMWEGFQTLLEILCLSENNSRCGTFIDVGANIGWHSISMATSLRNTGKVYSFEPHPINFTLLEKSKNINNLENIELNQIACSNKSGKAKLYMGDPSNMGTHSLHQESRTSPIDVDIITLDEFFRDRQIDDGPIVFKIDTEGSEWPVIQGGEKIIHRTCARASFFIEININDKTHSTEEAISIVNYFKCKNLYSFGMSHSRNKLYHLDYDYLEKLIEESMGKWGAFYGEFFFCSTSVVEKVKNFIHTTSNAITFDALLSSETET